MTIFYLPDLGEGLEGAEIREWYVKVGDVVKEDQPLVSVETAKALVDVPSPFSGKILKLAGLPQDFIKTGDMLVDIDTEKSVQDKGTVVGHLEESQQVLKEEVTMDAGPAALKTSIKAAPAARALAQQQGISLENIVPGGTQGQITVEDVKKAIDGQRGPSAMRSMARTMMHAHQEIVPVTIVDDADITSLAVDDDITVSVIQAMVKAIQQVPILNAWYDGKKMERLIQKDIHIGLAMDTEAGLFVPVIKNAEKQGPTTLRKIINEFKQSVGNRTIPLSDMQGATISFSNFGMFAGRYATPIVVPPMVAILGCGQIRSEPRVYQNNIAIRRILPLSLTFDHRAVKGSEASRFLGTLLQCFQT